jgi:hypothetical protein
MCTLNQNLRMACTMTDVQTESDTDRLLTPTEGSLATAVGVVMLCLSFLSLAVMIAIASPVVRLLEGLSK